jgi:hypothetical protein
MPIATRIVAILLVATLAVSAALDVTTQNGCTANQNVSKSSGLPRRERIGICTEMVAQNVRHLDWWSAHEEGRLFG